ncbi:MAG: hypothetical protein Q609_ECAC02282G0001, partial [Escherichia coli DORA_A_5_14_21]
VAESYVNCNIWLWRYAFSIKNIFYRRNWEVERLSG